MDRFAQATGAQLVDALKTMTAEQVVEFANFVVDHAVSTATDRGDAQAALLELANVLAAVARKKLNVKPRAQRVKDAGGIDSRERFGFQKGPR